MAKYGAEFQREKKYEKRLYNQIRDFLYKKWLERKQLIVENYTTFKRGKNSQFTQYDKRIKNWQKHSKNDS